MARYIKIFIALLIGLFGTFLALMGLYTAIVSCELGVLKFYELAQVNYSYEGLFSTAILGPIVFGTFSYLSFDYAVKLMDDKG